MSYLDRPSWTGDILVGALLAMAAATATAIALFFAAMLVVEPLIAIAGFPAVFVGFLFGMWCSFIALLFFGAPATLLLRRFGGERTVAYTLVGAAAGLAASLLVLRQTPWPFWFHVDAALSGAVGGITWWRSYRRHFQSAETQHA